MPKLICYRKRLTVQVHTAAGVLSERLTPEDICDLIPVSRATAYAYVSGQRPIPPVTLQLLQIKALGLIPDPKWSGFRVVDGVLWTDTDASFPLNALNDFARIYQENREHRNRINPPRVEREVKAVPLDRVTDYVLPPLVGKTVGSPTRAIKGGMMFSTCKHPNPDPPEPAQRPQIVNRSEPMPKPASAPLPLRVFRTAGIGQLAPRTD